MIHADPQVRAVLENLRPRPARTLMGTRFVDFPNDQSDTGWRRRNAEALRAGARDPAKLDAWRAFALSVAGAVDSPKLLFARQESRLMVDMAGGVFENGGLCLDRVSGVPFIPGSAVKGCARRTAIAALREFGVDDSPDQREAADHGFDFGENPLAPLTGGFASREEFLLAIALVFGWSDLEWKCREDFLSEDEWEKKRPDFAWACGGEWETVRANVTARLCKHLRIKPKNETSPWKSLPPFAGTITFFPAFPWEKDPCIDLDIVTGHHTEYYEGKRETATDTEEPNPVVFPAIAPGATWAFLLDGTRRAWSAHLNHAHTWLAVGLDAFGIGAKTNAGYGWFDASEAFDHSIKRHLLDRHRVEALEKEYRDFADWSEERKEEAILALSERLDDCQLWKDLSPGSFASIESFAESIEIPLT